MSLIFFLILNLLVHWRFLILNDQLAYGDLSPFPENFHQAFETFFYSWKETGLGIYRHPGHLQPFIQGILLFFFRNPLLSQIIYILLLPVTAFLSFRYYLRRKSREKDEFAELIAALFYAYSPIFLAEFIGGTIYSTLLTFSLFPVLFAKAEDLIKKGSLKNISILSILLGVMLSFNIQLIVIFMVSLIIPFLTSLFINPRGAFKSYSRFIFVGLFAFLINPIFLLDSFNIVSQSTALGQLSNFANSFDIFINDIKYTYQWSNMTNILRVGNNSTPLGYTANILWSIPFYGIFCLILIYLIRAITELKAKEQKIYILTVFLNLIFLAGFMYLTSRGLTFSIFRSFPVLFMFRNPAKLTSLVTFFLAVLMFYSVRWLNRFDFKKNWQKIGTNLCLLILVLIYLWPIFTGDKGLSLSRVGYTIPAKYKKALEILKKDGYDGEYHNLWLPSSHEATSIKLVWLDPRKIEVQIGLNQFSDDYYVDQIVNSLNSFILSNKSRELKSTLNIAQIRNIIVIKDNSRDIKTHSFYGVNYLKIGSERLRTFFGFLPIVYEDQELIIFRNNSIYPTVYSPRVIISSIQPLEFTISELNNYQAGFLPSIYSQQQNRQSIDLNIKSENIPLISSHKLSPTAYNLMIRNARGQLPLVASFTYHNGWKLQKNKMILDSNHFILNGYANGWLIDTDKFCRDNCLRNNDGSYDFNLQLTFEPQKYLQTSLIISFATLVTLLVVYLLS